MEESLRHLAVVIGSSRIADGLRRALARHGINHAGATSHLRGVRRSLVVADDDVVVLCIAMDRVTLARHGDSLRSLLADRHCFPHAFRSVGLLDQAGLTSEAAQVGCDMYVHDSRQALRAVRLLSRHLLAEHAAGPRLSRLMTEEPLNHSNDSLRNAVNRIQALMENERRNRSRRRRRDDAEPADRPHLRYDGEEERRQER